MHLPKKKFFLLYILYSLLLPSVVLADNPGPADLPQLQSLATRLINLSVYVALIALLVMLVLAGIKYLTSGGEAQAVKAAAQTLTWALLGILFLMLAWVILKIIQAFTGVDVTQFNLAFPG